VVRQIQRRLPSGAVVKPSMQRRASWLAGGVISLGALLLAFRGIQPERFFKALAQADYRFVVPAVLLLLIGLLARARSWHVLLGQAVPYRQAFDALNEGYLLNNLLPLRMGELGRAYLVSRGQAMGSGRALATVAVERLIDIVVSLAGLMLAIPFVVQPQMAGEAAFGAGVIFILMLVTLALIGLRPRVAKRITGLLPIPLLRRLIGDFIDGLSLLGQPRRLMRAGFWSLVAWATAWGQLGLVMRAFGLEASAVVWLFVSGIIAFGAAIPSSPGAIGIYELSALAGLATFGYPHLQALSTAVLLHGIQLAGTSLLGAWGLSRQGQTLLALAAAAQNLLRQSRSPAADS
jgi:uncharacterized protein (TIRG00374 family)